MAAHQAPLSLGFSRQEHWSGLPFPSPGHESEKWKWSRSFVFDSSRSHGLQPNRLLRPWDFPGKSTGVGYHCLLLPDIWFGLNSVSLQIKLLKKRSGCHKSRLLPPKTLNWDSVQFSSVAQSCPTLCDPMNCSTPGLPVHHQLLEFTQTHAHWVGDAIQPSHPLSSPSPPAPNPF